MANIRVNLTEPVYNGQAITFRSPTNCSQVTGLKVYYPNNGEETFKIFQLTDAHGNNVAGVSLFTGGVLVKVILDTETSKAFVQNADTNAYLEGRLNKLSNKSTVVSDTLVADLWSSGVYTWENSNILSSDQIIELVPSPSINEDQLKALQSANIVGTAQNKGSVTFKAFGTVPSTDIPVVFILRGDV